jgi:hypothetical protein
LVFGRKPQLGAAFLEQISKGIEYVDSGEMIRRRPVA